MGGASISLTTNDIVSFLVFTDREGTTSGVTTCPVSLVHKQPSTVRNSDEKPGPGNETTFLQ